MEMPEETIREYFIKFGEVSLKMYLSGSSMTISTNRKNARGYLGSSNTRLIHKCLLVYIGVL